MIRKTATRLQKHEAATVSCDAAGCDEEFAVEFPVDLAPRPGLLPTQEVWFAAYDQGWRNRAAADGYGVSSAVDLCPFHATRPNYL